MDHQPFSFATLVFESEYDLLELQARSAALYVDPAAIDKMVIIDNSEAPMPEAIRQRLMAAYGGLASKVQVLNLDDFGLSPRTNGYVRQQLLKLMVAEKVATPWYIVLDAKNHFVSSNFETFVVGAGGLPAINMYSFEGHPLEPALNRVLRYLDIDPTRHIKSFTPTVTPYPLYSEVVRELISRIEHQSGQSLEQEFLKEDLKEFFLYGAWLVASGRPPTSLYSILETRFPTVWPGEVARGGIPRAVDQARRLNAPFFTVHRKALGRIDANDIEVLSAFWAERKLFDTAADARLFLETARDRVRADGSAHSRRTLPSRLINLPRRALKKLSAALSGGRR